MPDKWEYPLVRGVGSRVPHGPTDDGGFPTFARNQLDLMMSPRYLHPTGQLPAYEWNFSGRETPPVHAFAHADDPPGQTSRWGSGPTDLSFPQGGVRQAGVELRVGG